MKKFLIAMAFVLVFVSFGPTFTDAASDQEITRAALDNIERMQLEGDKSWKSLIMEAFNSSWRLYREKPTVPETSFLVARAFFYNDRPGKAKKALNKTFYYDGKYVDAHILKVDIGLVNAKNDVEQYDGGIDSFQVELARRSYKKVLRLGGVDDEDRSEIFMKIGDLYVLTGMNRMRSVKYWQKSVDAAPESFWGKRSKRLLESNS